MESIANWNKKELQLGSELDSENELEVTILDKVHDCDVSLWITKTEVKRMIEHLANILPTPDASKRQLLIGLLTTLEVEGGNEFSNKEYIVDNYLDLNKKLNDLWESQQ